jgi:formate hydrogenlyase transcriptional activator
MTTIPQLSEGEPPSSASSRDFEHLLLEISSLFINLPVASIDEVIEQTQRKICESLGLDLSALWQWSDRDSNLMTITHLHTIPGGPNKPVDIDGSEAFPWIYARMLAGETMAYSTRDLPDEAAVDKQSRRYFGVESSVNIPLRAGGQRIIGILTFDTVNRYRLWRRKEVERLKLVADIFANILVRKKTEQDLLESEERLALAAESAEAGMWELDPRTDSFWATDQARRIFGYTSDESITMERIGQSVHSEDWAAVHQAIATSFKEKTKLDVEYRIIIDGDKCKWICSRGRPYFHDDGSPARMLGVSQDISERKQLEEERNRQAVELERLKQQVEQENYYLREDLKKVQGFEHMIGQSEPFRSLLTSAKQVAPTVATVLLTGETGTGKGVLAHAIHQMSERSERPFVTVNCAALPANLIESELFGRERGAFTGAHAKQAGRFEVANQGTLFLDEIGDLPLDMQAKLLRVLQEGEFERLGSPRTIMVDVRVIAATGRDLQEGIRTGRFREDLFYRFNVYPIALPPLRDRQEDIPLLAHYFIDKYSRKMGKKIDRIPTRVLDKMMKYPWPGNVRELEHLIERSVIISAGTTLAVNEHQLPPLSPGTGNGTIKNLAANERDYIVHVLGLTNWKIEGPGGAAAVLDIHPSTLRFRLKKLGIRRPA